MLESGRRSSCAGSGEEVKLRSWWSASPVVHAHTPSAPQGFTVVLGNFRESRGVSAIETCAEGVIVTLVPGDGDERSVDAASVRLLLTGPGVGEIWDEDAESTIAKQAKRVNP